MKKILLFSIFYFFHFSSVFAQCCPYLGDISIIPDNPTSSDSIFLLTNVSTPNQGSYLGYDIFELPDHTILVEACYWEGAATAPQTFVDTINLGILPAGTYSVIFKAILSNESATCNPIDSNSVQINLELSGSNPTKEISNAFEIRCFPNPVTQNLLYLQSKQTIKAIEITNAIGLHVFRKDDFADKHIEINMTGFANGIYFAKIISSDNKSIIQKITKSQ